MELFYTDNIKDLFISFLASLSVLVLSKLMNSMFIKFNQKNRRKKFIIEFGEKIKTILEKEDEVLNEKKIIRIYRSLLFKNDIDFPIIMDKNKIVTYVFTKLSNELNSNIVEKYIDELEMLLDNTESEIQKIDTKMLNDNNFGNINLIFVTLIIGLGTILLTFGIFYLVLNK